MLNRLLFTLLLCLSALTPQRSLALNVDQFMDICRSSGNPCVEHPLLQAYVGGALDFAAVLQEQTDYTRKLYCKNPKLPFDVAAIIQFIEANQQGYEEKNAMLLLIKYFEKHGGC